MDESTRLEHEKSESGCKVARNGGDGDIPETNVSSSTTVQGKDKAEPQFMEVDGVMREISED